MSCPTCHDVHAPHERRAMRLEDRNPPELCLACHSEKIALLDSPHDPRLEGEGAACTVCHPAHADGEEPPLWSLRSEAEGTWNDRKCSPCHGPPEDGPLLHAGAGSHPVNQVLPEGMKAKGLPLYDALGGRTGRGVVCSTCHDLHGTARGVGSRLPSFLRKSAEQAELCLACHEQESAIAGTPHDLRNAGDFALAPCGPCHTVHRSQTERFLWGLYPHDGDYYRNTLCRSCHVQGGAVESEVPLLQHHMKDAEEFLTPRATIYLQRPMLLLDEWALKTGETPVIPLYDRSGEVGPSGNLQCVSCHDPHLWSAMGSFIKPGFGALGPNVPTKFLKLREPKDAQRSVCASCHLQDADKRYEKYHSVWEDVGEGFR